MEKNADEQYNKMVNTPVWKLITKLAIPTIISMLVTSLYNMADTYFVSLTKALHKLQQLPFVCRSF